MRTRETVVIALGGNAIMSELRTFDSQYRRVSEATKEIARLAAEGYRIVITHGNGPQVGDTLLRHESARKLVPPLPLFACVAETQGLLGLMIQASLVNHLKKFGRRTGVASLITKVRVSPDDPAFSDPTKPVGPTYTKSELVEIKKLNPSIVVKQIATGRYRRVVPSPDPISVLELEAVKRLSAAGQIVVAAGGGGVPVVIEKKTMKFVDAVIDKDLAGERLATGIGATRFVSLTDIEGVYLDYRTERRRLLRSVSVKEMKLLLRRGEFEKGSMEPKVRAAVRFVENTGNKAVIAHLGRVREAVSGESGTVIHG